ncbi:MULTISPECIES: TIGR03621 family F420-dependent LLM class oxidoreductase [unclassified Frankia]|uniref:TIGR03621 family F420-dependent LLM class oxidoreductase n=1 Tax=unclassified Frankia TaxID=2632575 RepID=UPI002AD50355|nr:MULTISPECIES: TIGR03621 family F420-dependent LLM class oxidoreductase [unclassified Frankia]
MSTRRPFRFAAQSYRAADAREWKDTVRRVEELGYSALHVCDHYIGAGPAMDPTGHRPVTLAPVPAMAVAAEVSSVLRIGCRMFCVGYHQPVVLAKEIATLAVLAEGRIEAGLGAGWLEAEYTAMGVPFDSGAHRVDLLAEVLELLDIWFAGKDVAVDGGQVRAAGFAPLPVPKLRPPLMVGGGSPRVLRLAGERADIVSINFDNRSGVIGPASIAGSGPEQTHRKLAWVRQGAGERFDDIELETAAYFVAIEGAAGTTEAELSAQTGLDAAGLRAFPHALVGSVDEICDQLERRREEYGFSYITVGDRVLDSFAPVVARLTGR